MKTVREILCEAARHCGVLPVLLSGEGRERRLVRARFAAWRTARRHSGASATMIGRRTGGRDHSTVLNGLARAEALYESDADFRALCHALEEFAPPWQPGCESDAAIEQIDSATAALHNVRAIGLDAPSTHVWYWRTVLPERKGQPCRLLATGSLNSALIEFADGTQVITNRRAVRRASRS